MLTALLTRHQDQLNDTTALAAETLEMLQAAEHQGAQQGNRKPLSDLYIEAGALDGSLKGVTLHPDGFSYVLSLLGVHLILLTQDGDAPEAAVLATCFLQGASGAAQHAPKSAGLSQFTWGQTNAIRVLHHWLKDAYENLGRGVIDHIEAQRAIITLSGKVRLIWKQPEPGAIAFRVPA